LRLQCLNSRRLAVYLDGLSVRTNRSVITNKQPSYFHVQSELLSDSCSSPTCIKEEQSSEGERQSGGQQLAGDAEQKQTGPTGPGTHIFSNEELAEGQLGIQPLFRSHGSFNTILAERQTYQNHACGVTENLQSNSVRVCFGADKREQCLKGYSL